MIDAFRQAYMSGFHVAVGVAGAVLLVAALRREPVHPGPEPRDRGDRSRRRRGARDGALSDEAASRYAPGLNTMSAITSNSTT